MQSDLKLVQRRFVLWALKMKHGLFVAPQNKKLESGPGELESECEASKLRLHERTQGLVSHGGLMCSCGLLNHMLVLVCSLLVWLLELSPTQVSLILRLHTSHEPRGGGPTEQLRLGSPPRRHTWAQMDKPCVIFT